MLSTGASVTRFRPRCSSYWAPAFPHDRGLSTPWTTTPPTRLHPSGIVEHVTDIPPFFCWSKVGDEAGEPIARIIARKEAARAADGGVFLWGIGQSVGAGVRLLTERIAGP